MSILFMFYSVFSIDELVNYAYDAIGTIWIFSIRGMIAFLLSVDA